MAKVIAPIAGPCYNQAEKYDVLHPPNKVDIRWIPDESVWQNRLKYGAADVGAYVCNSLIIGSNPLVAFLKISKTNVFEVFYFIGNFVPYKVKPSGGSHCGEMELCRNIR